ncbi:hypothetical protein V5O48_002426 [Marasmius crinis-equi]|uniref:Arrestin-like N-terminal domain-containing protein n=1 Tax=Marasmius crinis-equi TaxID=585013 RepID=A0ABR3FVR1_9AGAR
MPPRTPTITSMTSTGIRHEHSFSMDREGHKWLMVTVQSRSRSTASAPAFLEGDTITGHLELDVNRPEAIKEVTIAVEGVLTSVQQDELKFLSMKTILWRPDGKSDKFFGKYAWGFTFTLPPQVAVGQAMYRLPPNYSEKTLSSTFVDYRLVANVKRGSFKPNITISQGFIYKPVSTPPPPSMRRQMAYRSGHAPPSPAEDPEGWKVLPTQSVRGRTLGRSVAEVRCTLAIALPLCYSAKSTIPLAMMMASNDEQSLAQLSNPSAVRVTLMKHVVTGPGEKKSNVVKVVAGRANFWSSNNNYGHGVRYLEGALEIPAGLQPSFEFPKLTVQYTVDLLPLGAWGPAQFDAHRETAVLSEYITLTMMQPSGSTTRLPASGLAR